MSTKTLGDPRRKLALAAAGLSAIWVLPLWLVTFPPMVDYPQQLALSAILRWYADPARRFRETYELALWAPHGLFKLLTAGLALVMPINVAGKLVVSAALLAVGAAALAVCRRTGKPGAYALLALAMTYNPVFYWGFVDNLLAFPLALAGVAMVEGMFERPFGVRPWLALAGVTLLFYAVHLQFLLLFAGMVGWLAICRRPPLRRLALWLSALLPGLAACAAVMAYGVLRSPVGVISEYERRMRSSAPVRLPLVEKLAALPDLLFGNHPDRTAWVLTGLVILAAALALLFREKFVGCAVRTDDAAEAADGAQSAPYGQASFLFRTRFATLAGWLFLLYLILPEFRAGYLIASRVAPFAAMVAVLALPAVRPERRRLVALVAAAVVVFQLGQTVSAFLRFRTESAGLDELLAGTAPGESLAGLIVDRGSASWPGVPVYLHFPAFYQVEKGGRILFSFAELFQTSARFRPGKSWDDLLREWNEWNPQFFDYGRHGGRFRYFLIRGGAGDVKAVFGGDPRRLGLVGKRDGEWWLFERAGQNFY